MAKRSGLHSNPLFMPTIKDETPENQGPPVVDEKSQSLTQQEGTERGQTGADGAPAGDSGTPAGGHVELLDGGPASLSTRAPADMPAGVPGHTPESAAAPSPVPPAREMLLTSPKIAKFTFYFLPEQLQRLDDAWLRTLTGHAFRFNKSEFIRLAIDRLLDDFEKQPQEIIDQLRVQANREAANYPGKRKH